MITKAILFVVLWSGGNILLEQNEVGYLAVAIYSSIITMIGCYAFWEINFYEDD